MSQLEAHQYSSLQRLTDGGIIFLKETPNSTETLTNLDFSFNYPYFDDLKHNLENNGFHVGFKSFFSSAQCGVSTAVSCLGERSSLSTEAAQSWISEWTGYLQAIPEEEAYAFLFHIPSDLELENGTLVFDWVTGRLLDSPRVSNSDTLIMWAIQDYFRISQFPHQHNSLSSYTGAKPDLVSLGERYSVCGGVFWPGVVASNVWVELDLIPQSFAKTIYSLTDVELPADMNTPKVRDLAQPLLDYKDVQIIEDFLSEEDCEYAIKKTFPANDPLHKKEVNESNKYSPERKWLYRAMDKWVVTVSERLENITHYPVINMEDFQVAYTKTGQGTTGRFEACSGNSEYCTKDRERGGLRAISAWIFLNDDYVGGELDFPARGLSFPAKRGTAIIVKNINSQQKQHAGAYYLERLVTSGVKYLAYLFIREEEFAYKAPKYEEPPPYISTANMTEMQLAALNSTHGPVVSGTVGPCNEVCTTNETDGDYAVTYYDNFITDEECDYLIELAKPKLKRSSVMGEKTVVESRTSRNTFVGRDDPVVDRIAHRIAGVVNLPVPNQEPMQVVHYLKGQEYKHHFDACIADHISCVNDRKRGGYRYVTMFLYLNDDFKGGGTGFPYMRCSSKAKKKRGVVFYNLNTANTTAHPYASHSGEPVTEGEKFGANVWIRLGTF